MIPLLTDCLTKIPHCNVIPIINAIQPTLDKMGNKIQKKNRTIYDCSFPSLSGTSLYAQHITEDLDECIYGQCIRRILYQLQQLRLEHPNKKMFVCKYDMDAAYRRLHMHPDDAFRAATIIDGLAYLLTRLPFGAVAGPSLFSRSSEAIFVLLNDLIDDTSWDPFTFHSPIAQDLNKPFPLPSNIPFKKTKPLIVYLPTRTAFVDGYIDDAITVSVDVSDSVSRGQQAVTVAHQIQMKPQQETHL